MVLFIRTIISKLLARVFIFILEWNKFGQHQKKKLYMWFKTSWEEEEEEEERV